MNKILILYASYGGGHFNAAKAIKEYIDLNYYNVETQIIDFMKYINTGIDKVTTSAYSEMAKKAPWAWGKMYEKSNEGVLSKISESSNKVLSLKLYSLIKDFDPNLVISTHPFSSQMISFLKKKKNLNCKLATILTDFAPHEQWLVGHEYTDYFFVSHDELKENLIINNIDKNKIFVTGIPISQKFTMKYDKNKTLKDMKLKSDKKIAIFFGGGALGLGKTRTLEIFEALLSCTDKFQIIAISGKNAKMYKAFSELISENNKKDDVILLSFTKRVAQLMSISDVVISKPGGLTTSECMASNLPILIINPIPGQEEENAQFLVKSGVAIWMKKNNDYKHIITNFLSDSELLNKMKENTKKISHKNSTQEICEILLQNKKD